ncbi:uncharacterized protein LOC134283706 [Saccostrea cucullata]|uniref:uncharacterized protein LOC134283706 n=1 Tax=Saccostrea cuccullata TaxID=36930 RepID=UPI002ED0AB72
MASSKLNQGQYYIECDICNNPINFKCKRCFVNLCTTCVGPHLLSKSENGHNVVKYNEQSNPEVGECLVHPQQQCCSFCKTCDIPVCVLCLTIKHKEHDTCELSEKVGILSDFITEKNKQLQSMRSKFETVLAHIIARSAVLPQVYKQTKSNVSSFARERHQDIDKTEKAMHKDLDHMQEKHSDELLKKKREFEKIEKKFKSLKQKVFSLAKSKDVSGLMKLKLEIENQQVPTFIEEIRPAFFQPCMMNESLTSSYLGHIETIASHRLTIDNLTQGDKLSSQLSVLDVPIVLSTIDTGFPANKTNNNRLYAVVPISDDRFWAGGESKEVKLFDVQGRLQDTLIKNDIGLHLTHLNENVVYIDYTKKSVNSLKESIDHTCFFIGEWDSYGIACTGAGDLLVCLYKTDKTDSKIVRYSSSGDVLQEIQYDSQYQPLFKRAVYAVENGNGDICVADWDKNAVTVVDNLGIFRFSYTGNKATKDEIRYCSLTTDSMHHIIINDFLHHKIHMLDRDGRFLRYIIPDQGIKNPRAVCVIREGELLVGECITGIIKRIKYLA